MWLQPRPRAPVPAEAPLRPGSLPPNSAPRGHVVKAGTGIRVLVLSHLYPSAAQPTRGIFVHRQVLALRRAGVEVSVVAPVPAVPPGGARFGNYRFYHTVPRRDELEGIPVEYPRFLQPPRNLVRGIGTLMFARSVKGPLSNAVNTFRPDLLHCHMATPDGYTGAWAKKALGIPTVCTLRGSDINVAPGSGPLIRRLSVHALNSADRVTAVSSALCAAAGKLVSRTIDVVYTGLDSRQFRPDISLRLAKRSELGIAEDTCVFGFVGNLIEEKGIYALLDAFAELPSSASPPVLVIVGGGPHYHGLRLAAEERGVLARTRFSGGVAADEVPAYLNAMDVLVLPSIREGLPNAIVEGLACGCAVVASRVGGVEEVVEDGQTGLLVEPTDQADLVKACLRVATEPHLRRDLAAAGRESVARRFSWERNALDVIEIYRATLSWPVSNRTDPPALHGE